MTRLGVLCALVAGCAMDAPAGGGPVSGSATVTGGATATSSWMGPSQVCDDSMPDAPKPYFGWTIVFSNDPPGTPCSQLTEPAWTLELTVLSATRGATPDDAPLTLGEVAVTYQGSGAYLELDQLGAVVNAGHVTVSEADDAVIAGDFSATGSSGSSGGQAIAVSGSFHALRCP